MPINPSDPQAHTPEEIAAKYGDLVKKELYEIGYAYIGERKFNCDENRQHSQKRFKINDRKDSYGVDLWYGTSQWVDCDEASDNDEAENPTYEINNKSIYLSIFIFQLNENLEIIFNIVDRLDILYLKSGFSHQELTSIDDLLTKLNKVRSDLQKHS